MESWERKERSRQGTGVTRIQREWEGVASSGERDNSDCAGGSADESRRKGISRAQRRIWRERKRVGDSHLIGSWRLTGLLDGEALRIALERLVERYEILRTTFEEVAGVLTSTVASSSELLVQFEEVVAGADQIEEMLRREARTPFDTARGPLIRTRLVKISDEEHVLIVAMHNLIADRASFNVLLQEILILYSAIHVGKDEQRLHPAVQYTDIAELVSCEIIEEHVSDQLNCLRTRLAEFPDPTRLKPDRSPPEGRAPAGGRVASTLPQNITQALRKAAEELGVSVFGVVLAGWAILIGRWVNEDEVVIGAFVSERAESARRKIIGPLETQMAVKVCLEEGVALSEIVRGIEEQLREAQNNPDVGLEEVLKELEPSRSRSEGMTVWVEYQEGVQGAPASVDDELVYINSKEMLLVHSEHQYELLLSMREEAGGLVSAIGYDSGRFERHTIEQLLGCWHTVLSQVASGRPKNVGELTLLSESARQHVLGVFNSTEVRYPEGLLVHELFEMQVERTPEAVAVVFEDVALTYAQLNARANCLAYYLRANGVGPDQLVGICSERSLEMVVGLFGILKAGGAYVPMDPSHPAQRLRHIVADAAPKVVLIQDHLRGRLPETDAVVFALDHDWEKIAAEPVMNINPQCIGLHSRHLAYVIYTSGSTGEPKGAMNEHRGVVNRLQWMQDCYSLSTEDGVLQKTPFSFDVSVWEFFWTLMSGARLVVARPQGHKDPFYLKEVIQQSGVTTLHFVPSMLQSFLAEHRPGECGALRHVVCSGEELSAALQRRCFERLPDVKLSNLYGPTEAAVDVTVWECVAGDDSLRVPIGRPIANIRMYVLDRRRRPVPIGAVGEIYIGGIGVGRGYLNRPELTEDRFVADPFSRIQAARMYKTGDLGRWRADGTIEYLGRTDHQVKIRGFRIEPGEIEAQMLTYPNILETVVIPREDVPGEKRLVAYVVADVARLEALQQQESKDHGQELGESSVRSVQQWLIPKLREHIKARLPSYMIPSAFMMLSHLPVGPNGKLNRRALPAPDTNAYSSAKYEAPLGEIEEALARIWQSLLQIDLIGRQDNFFELGGHSLLLIQLIGRLREAGLFAEAGHFLESPTLANLARSLVSRAEQEVVVPQNLIPEHCERIIPAMLPLVQLDPEHIERIVAAVPGGAANIQDIYPLAPLQEGLLFHYLIDRNGGDAYVLSTLLSIDSQPVLKSFISALQRVVDRHDALRSAVFWEQLPCPVQVVCRRVAISVTDIKADQDRDPLEVLKALMASEHQRLDLRSAPLVKLQVAECSKHDRSYALLQTHHMVCDYESVETMLSEVLALMEGRVRELPEAVPYRVHVAEALAHARSRDTETFFRSKLAEFDEPTAPFGLLDVMGDGSGVEEACLEIGSEVTQELRQVARSLGTTAGILFHAAWALVIARTSGRKDVVFGTVLSGRLQGTAGARQSLGMFINTLPLALHLDDISVSDLVAQTQRELGELLGHEQASLAVAHRCSGVPKSTPLFSALLNYRHQIEERSADRLISKGIRTIASKERSNYPVTLSVDDLTSGITLRALTDRRIDPNRVIGYLYTALRALIEALKKAQNTNALKLSILPESERQQLAYSFNATHADYPEEMLVNQLFEVHAERVPDAVAVNQAGEALTYAELNHKANQLARCLTHKGVGPDERVAICVARSVDMVVAMLGTLKAGGGYVPLDPSYPVERLQYMLVRSQPRVLLTEMSSVGLSLRTTAERILMDVDWHLIANTVSVNIDSHILGTRARNLAYTIYTSGSTGEPKGVMIDHRSLHNLVSWHIETFGLKVGSRSSSMAGISFDATTWEIWPILCGGGTLLLPPRGVSGDPEKMLSWWQRERLDIGFLVTPLAELAYASGKINPGLRTVLIGGDRLRRWPESLPEGQALVNNYGPTEGTVVATSGRLYPSDGVLHIGRPIRNARAYILDQDLQTAPVGVAGELYVGGHGVGRGYQGRPQLTAERFIADPFDDGSGARMYKTGDLASWRPDGSIEYLGRNDHQVKLRGFRIELGEIETQLCQLGTVKEAVAVVREDGIGERRLVAYVVPREEPGSQLQPSAEHLRAHLRRVLPAYMVPSAFVYLPSIPLTANGKLDRRSLPPPQETFGDGQFDASKGEVEEILTAIWKDLLHLERVGRNDNFFELGGHSLMIVQMMERLRRVGLSGDVRLVFERPSLAQLAAALAWGTAGEMVVPPNLIPLGCDAILPEMLTLIALSPAEIDTIVRTTPGGACNIQDIYPLTPLQEGLLFHHLYGLERGDTYIVAVLLSVSSRDRLEQLIPALQRVIERHDALRTAVLWEDLHRPVQVVHRRAQLPVEVVALNSHQGALEQLKERMRPDRLRLDLRRAPMIGLQVAEDTESGQCYALLQVHHIICDHVTSSVMAAEVVAYLEEKEEPPGADTQSYRAHVAHVLAYANVGGTESFFRGKLGDVDEPTVPFGLHEVFSGGQEIEEAQQRVEAVLAKRIRALSRRLGVTAATLFHAAWGLVVAGTSGRDDVVFGTVLLGRLQATGSAKGVLGMFINTLPLRLKLAELTATALVEHTQRELIELLCNEHASLALAQRCSGVSGSTPLFTCLLNYRHSAETQEARWSDARGLEVLVDQERTNYPITVSVDDRGEDFALTAQTDRRIDPSRVTGLLHAAVRSLVDALEEAPHTPSLSLSILPEEEHRRVVELFNTTGAGYAQEPLIHEIFEAQVECTPEATAVSYLEQSLSYAQLNARANQVARELQYLGVGANDLVGLCVERGLDLVTGVLGILKSGGAYVPLDPAYPMERLAYMLADAAPRVLLTQSQLTASLPGGETRVVVLDRDWDAISAQPVGNVTGVADAQSDDRLAYVIYTSGSTGNPKGVKVTHANIVRLFAATKNWFNFNERDVWTLFHSYAFDFSVWEIWGALLYGGRLVVVPQVTARSPDDFYSLICARGVTVLNQTPSAFRQLIDVQSRSEARLALRVVIFGGEALDFQTLRPWVERNGTENPQLVNMYGITETTVHVTYRRLTKEDIQSETGSVVGKPIPDLRVYLLDSHGKPVPIGVAGEIYVAGAGVAQGYLNQPQLTDYRFVRDRFRADPGARMYRSGDLGRWRADGSIEYLGRNDHQVKIRGFRIELGEIEAQITLDDQVRQAILLVQEATSGDKRLVAYVVMNEPSGVATDESVTRLRRRLSERLPDYMVPSAIVPISEVPMTPNGKVDRRALPLPDRSGYVDRDYETPQGPTENTLAEIWKDLLRVAKVGRNDRFFELGGHSLMALKLALNIRQVFGAVLRIADVYSHSTLQGLASRIEGQAIADERINLLREAALDAEIVYKPGNRRVPARTILLTGATGFVGRFLLAQLIEDTDATIYCLVRAPSSKLSMSRLRSTLVKWDLWRDEMEWRIRALPGDLSLPQLGLDEGTYASLCVEVDCIFHCGISMNHLETYWMAKPTNVGSAVELLRLATRGTPKLVNHISTLSVFSDREHGYPRVVNEQSRIENEIHLASQGYAASKWVSEKIIMTASERGIPCNIFRLGLTWADTKHGRYDELQREHRLFRTCLLSGLGIRQYRYDMPATPVDYVARAVVALAARYSDGNGVFHISSERQHVEDDAGLFERCNQIAGTSLDLLSYYEWISEIKRLHHEGRTLPAVPLVEFAFSMDEPSFLEHRRKSVAGRPSFDCAATHRELEQMGIAAPFFDGALLKTYVMGTLHRDEELTDLASLVRSQNIKRRLGT